MRGVRASGRGEAAGACEVQSVPPGPASAVASSVPAFAASLRLSLHVFYVGFMKVLHKTRVYGIGFMANPLKTHVWCISCRKNLIKTRV